MKRVAWLLGAGALLAAATAGAAGPLTFTTTSLVAAGPTVLTGGLAALEAFSPRDAPVAGWTVELDGTGAFQVETVQKLAAGSLVGVQPQEPSERFVPAGDAWTGAQWSNDSFLFIRDTPGQPAPAITFTPLATRLAAPAVGCVQAPAKFGHQSRPACRQVAGAASGSFLRGHVDVEVRGAFEFVAWGWTFGNGTASVRTGQDDLVSSPASPPQAGGDDGRVRWVNMTTALGRYADGALTLHVDAEALRNLYIEGLTVSTDGVMIAQGAEAGQARTDLQLDGGTQVAVRPAGSRLLVEVLRHESVGVASLPPPVQPATAVAPAPAHGQPWAAAAGVALTGLALLAALLLRGRRDPLARVFRQLEAGQHQRALAAVARSGLPAGQSLVLRVIALIKAGRLAQAEAALADPDGALDAAARHFLLAAVAASRHQDDEARRQLAACFRHDEAYQREAALNGSLRRVLRLDPPGGVWEARA